MNKLKQILNRIDSVEIIASDSEDDNSVIELELVGKDFEKPVPFLTNIPYAHSSTRNDYTTLAEYRFTMGLITRHTMTEILQITYRSINAAARKGYTESGSKDEYQYAGKSYKFKFNNQFKCISDALYKDQKLIDFSEDEIESDSIMRAMLHSEVLHFSLGLSENKLLFELYVNTIDNW